MPGEAITFSVKVGTEAENSKIEYDWSVSAGTIIEGQGTSMIRVATTSDMSGGSVRAKVTIQGLPTICLSEMSETKQIENIPVGCGLLDDYEKVSTLEAKALLDNLFSQLVYNPETIAFFRLGRDKNESVKQTKSRINRIMKHINFRKMDKNRFVFAIDKSETNSFGYLTSAVLVPKNKDFPECENCEIIKGADVK